MHSEAAAARSAVPFIGFISERELREREERHAGSASGGELSLSLEAGTPPLAPQHQHELSWAEVWQQGAGDGAGLSAGAQFAEPQTVFAVARHSTSAAAHAMRPPSATVAMQQSGSALQGGRATARPFGAPPSPKKEGPPSPIKTDQRSPGLMARDSLRMPESPATRRLRSSACQSLPHLPSLPGPAAEGRDDHTLSAVRAAAHPAQPPSLLSSAGASTGDDLGRCGVGLLCEKERGSPAAVVREVSSRGSAAREGTIRAGDLVLSVCACACACAVCLFV